MFMLSFILLYIEYPTANISSFLKELEQGNLREIDCSSPLQIFCDLHAVVRPAESLTASDLGGSVRSP